MFWLIVEPQELVKNRQQTPKPKRYRDNCRGDRGGVLTSAHEPSP